MKRKSSTHKISPRTRPEVRIQAAPEENGCLFLGMKVLHELRVLARLARTDDRGC